MTRSILNRNRLRNHSRILLTHCRLREAILREDVSACQRIADCGRLMRDRFPAFPKRHAKHRWRPFYPLSPGERKNRRVRSLMSWMNEQPGPVRMQTIFADWVGKPRRGNRRLEMIISMILQRAGWRKTRHRTGKRWAEQFYERQRY